MRQKSKKIKYLCGTSTVVCSILTLLSMYDHLHGLPQTQELNASLWASKHWFVNTLMTSKCLSSLNIYFMICIIHALEGL